MIINTQYTSNINLAEAIQISLIHKNHDHIQHDIDEKVGFMYLPIELHPHTIFIHQENVINLRFRLSIIPTPKTSRLFLQTTSVLEQSTQSSLMC